MRINENLLLNNNKLTVPSYEKGKAIISFKDGKIYFDNLNSFISNMTVDGANETLSESIDPNATYYVGVYGKIDKTLKIYKGDTYKTAKTIGDFHYIEIKGDKIKGATYILSNESANGYIYGLGVYKDYPSDVYVPNKKSLEVNLQNLYPPEGEYKEIQAI
ncbi:hypothetical protein [Anaerococcus vaginimassiliensis]|uniref:hypothetical protein n=1 Tax=Anaerococcus vaginimassiliensis TaxID=2042308 RepID=UPI001031F811|nr:hypothetical protein [Anaerococcus vaginimassiliensis]